jgi:HK97 family phage major capsid protein
MLLGRPIVISQHAASFTSAGDVQLHDLSYYRTITKSGGVETATSMHLYFDADVTAYRTTFRIDGKPKIAAQISPANGTNKMSPFLKLQAR